MNQKRFHSDVFALSHLKNGLARLSPPSELFKKVFKLFSETIRTNKKAPLIGAFFTLL